MENNVVTLDGVFWDKNEIIQKMYDDNFYYGYLGQNALSSSAIKKLTKSPKAYNLSLLGNSESTALTLGSLVHLSILEPEKFLELNFVDVQSRNTKKFKEELEKNPNSYTMKEQQSAMYLSDAVFNNSEAMELLRGKETEKPAISEIMGLPFRGKADAIGNGMIVDLKTCQDVESFRYDARKFKYQSQVFIYCNLFGIDYKDFVFLAVDKQANDIGIFNVSEEFYYQGESQVEYGVNVYNNYIKNGGDIENYTVKGIL